MVTGIKMVRGTVLSFKVTRVRRETVKEVVEVMGGARQGRTRGNNLALKASRCNSSHSLSPGGVN